MCRRRQLLWLINKPSCRYVAPQPLQRLGANRHAHIARSEHTHACVCHILACRLCGAPRALRAIDLHHQPCLTGTIFNKQQLTYTISLA